MRINRRTLTLAMLASLSCTTTGSALACGEVMFRMGGALRYQSFVTRHPARILIYSSDVAVNSTAAERELFRRSLEKAGHRVTLVDSPSTLDQALATQGYDIVITGAANVAAVNAAMTNANRHPAVIPVLHPGQDGALRTTYPLAVNSDANLNRYLKSIETSMRTRGS